MSVNRTGNTYDSFEKAPHPHKASGFWENENMKQNHSDMEHWQGYGMNQQGKKSTVNSDQVVIA